MKLEVTKPTQFQPVSISLTAESQAELDALGSLFNCSFIMEALRGMGVKLDNGFSQFIEAGANVDRTEDIYSVLRKRLRAS